MHYRSVENNVLSGFWKADADFLQSADLLNMHLYIEPGNFFTTTREGYILATNINGIIINNPVKFTINSSALLNPILPYQRDLCIYDINIDWLDDEEYDFFPSDQQIYLYTSNYKMYLAKDDEVYAILYRDHAMDDYSNVGPDNLKDNSDKPAYDTIDDGDDGDDGDDDNVNDYDALPDDL